jgi:hypothetical protein
MSGAAHAPPSYRKKDPRAETLSKPRNLQAPIGMQASTQGYLVGLCAEYT